MYTESEIHVEPVIRSRGSVKPHNVSRDARAEVREGGLRKSKRGVGANGGGEMIQRVGRVFLERVMFCVQYIVHENMYVCMNIHVVLAFWIDHQ